MKLLRLAAAAIVAVAIPVMSSAPAGATINGPCKASGTLKSTGVNYNASIKKVTIPLKDDVAWKGSVPGAGKRAISGSVHVKFPWPIGDINIGSWGKTSDTHQNKGTYKYDLPKELAGFDIPVSGSHTEPGIKCTGTVIVRFKGGGFGNPAVIGTFVLTVISGVSLLISFRPKGA